jgi:hypothetical protein
MIETGTVRTMDSEGKIVKVQLKKPDGGCMGCANTQCKNSGNIISATNPKGISLVEGQSVDVEIGSGSIWSDVRRSIIMPIICGVAGWYMAAPLAEHWGEGLHFAGAALLFFAAAIGYYLLRRKHPANTSPRIVG